VKYPKLCHKIVLQGEPKINIIEGNYFRSKDEAEKRKDTIIEQYHEEQNKNVNITKVVHHNYIRIIMKKLKFKNHKQINDNIKLVEDMVIENYDNMGTRNNFYTAMIFIASHYNNPYISTLRENRDKIIKDINENKSNLQNPYNMTQKDIIQLREYYKTSQHKKRNDHMAYLLLCFLTYQPVLRSSFYTTSIIIYDQNKNDNINNFVMIDKKDKTIKFIVNKDKVSKFKYKKKIIPVNGVLYDILIDSLKRYPRNYLFFYGPKQTSQLLLFIKKINNTNKYLSMAIARTACITAFHSKKRTAREYLDFSERCRNTIRIQLDEYVKEPHDGH
jgi:hypothetical protein